MIETENLILRDYTLNDLEKFSEMNEDPKFQRFYSEEDCSPEKCRELIAIFSLEKNTTPRTNYNLVITLKSDPGFIGCTGIRLERDYQASVGCALTRKFQNIKIAKEAMLAIADFGFNHLNAHRIYAETISDNKAAIALCRKIGMRREAEFVQHRYFKNKWWNTSVFALLKSEFHEQRWRMDGVSP